MGYRAEDERFTHQIPRPFDEVHHPDGSWSDRCYFFVHSPGGDLLLTTGYGNNPNQRQGMGYCKVALADGRHWDFSAGRPVSGDDRGELHAGPMRWTCIEPLKHWLVELGPNESGIEWEMHYTPRAPMWELLPMEVELDGRTILDMYHMKEPGEWTGWVRIDGEEISVDGFHGGRDRTFGVRAASDINFWLWLDLGFDDRAIEAWIIEGHDGTVHYVDGGITFTDGSRSKRFVKMEHDIEFDGDRKRPARVALVFTDEDGREYRVTGESKHQQVGVYYGLPLPTMKFHEGVDEGGYSFHFSWNSTNTDELVALEADAMSIDQLMHFELDGQPGIGIFEILSGSDGYERYPNWPVMDMTPFLQKAKKPEA